MSIINYGYACINLTLKKQNIYTGRSLIQKTFKEKGLDYVSELSLKNVIDLKKIIEWNVINNFKVFRISSDIFPWWSEYEVNQLKDYTQIEEILVEIGKIATLNNLRLSFHPDHFNKLGSSNQIIINKTIKDIEQHSLVFDIMKLIPSHYNKINIHVGGSYNDKKRTLEAFCNNFSKLSKNCQKRVTVENDDKEALYSVKELYQNVYSEIKIPIVFDYHHHSIYGNQQSEEEAYHLAYSTWDITPVFHYSEGREDKVRAHSDYVFKPINSYGKDIDIVIEAKAKELAVLNLVKII